MKSSGFRRVSRYKYEPLREPSHIRTLTLKGISNGIISCTIQQISITEGGYQALSYVWGSEEKPFYVRVHDAKGKHLGRIPLTKNLNDALLDLWNAEELTSKVFWIDQICIDQEGTEKNHQVAFMGQVYKNASRVITYLGPVENEEEEKEGLELLSRLDSHFSPNYDLLSQIDDPYTTFLRRSEFPVLKLPDDLAGDAVSEERWQWLASLCFGEWATRLWIVQEQMLNTENIMLHGHRLLSWEAVLVMSILFCLQLLPTHHLHEFWRASRRFDHNPWDILGPIFSIWIFYSRKRRGPWAVTSFDGSLLSNMIRFEPLQCRDPRDRIFALRAISSDSSELGITPDYSKTPRQVFLDASITFLEYYVNLDFLSFACTLDSLSDLTYPSWAIASPRPAHLQVYQLECRVFTPHPYYDLHPQLRIDVNGINPVLTLKGRIVDHIALTTSPIYASKSFELGIDDATYTQTCSQHADTLSDILRSLGITLENTAALCSAFICNPTWKPSQGKGSLIQQTAYDFWCYIRYLDSLMKEGCQRLGIEIHGGVEYDHLIESLAPLILGTDLNAFKPKDGLDPTEIEAAMNIWNHRLCQGRSFCITKQRRVCSCMNKIENDDVIAAFRGADKLFVLRPAEGGRYRLVGDAYVDGLMFGEAYEGVDADEVDYDIELI